jgi:hypothetical protein
MPRGGAVTLADVRELREEHPGPFLHHEHQAANTLYLAGKLEAAHQTARLNMKAARWTAVAVALSGASSLFGSLA